MVLNRSKSMQTKKRHWFDWSEPLLSPNECFWLDLSSLSLYPRSMPTAEFAESTSLTDYTRKMNCQLNSSFTSQCSRKNNRINFHCNEFPPFPICKYIQDSIKYILIKKVNSWNIFEGNKLLNDSAFKICEYSYIYSHC